MRGNSGKRFPWLMAGSAQFDPYASTLERYAVAGAEPPLRPLGRTGELEILVQRAYRQADAEVGQRLAAVLLNLRRRTALARLPAAFPPRAGRAANDP